jgi:hypothetical protein
MDERIRRLERDLKASGMLGEFVLATLENLPEETLQQVRAKSQAILQNKSDFRSIRDSIRRILLEPRTTFPMLEYTPPIRRLLHGIAMESQTRQAVNRVNG